jgi:hypothetical protein
LALTLHYHFSRNLPYAVLRHVVPVNQVDTILLQTQRLGVDATQSIEAPIAVLSDESRLILFGIKASHQIDTLYHVA